MSYISWGQYSIDSHIGVTFTNHRTGDSIFFQPGDEQGDFHDKLEAYEIAYPDKDYVDILALLWDDYEPLLGSYTYDRAA